MIERPADPTDTADPAERAVRDAMDRAGATVPDPTDLVGRMHWRATVIRRRRRAVGAGAGLCVLALAGVGLAAWPGTGPATVTIQPAEDPDQPPPAPSPSPTGTAPSTVGTPTAAHTDVPDEPAEPIRPARPWGRTTLAEDFTGQLDTTRWNPYSGPSQSTASTWSPAAVTTRPEDGGTLRLSVSRTGVAAPSVRAGGLKAASGGHRYGRWELRWRMTATPGVTGQFVLFGPGPGGIAQVATLNPAAGTLTLQDLARGSSRTVRLDGTRWHTVAVESTPQAVRWLVDGDVVVSEPRGAPSGSVVPAVQALVQGSDCGTRPLPADCSGPARYPQHLDVDYVRAWRYSR